MFSLPRQTETRQTSTSQAEISWWRIVPPTREPSAQLVLPFEEKPNPGDVRRHMSGFTLRLYLATLAAAQEFDPQGARGGVFPWEPLHIGRDLLGLSTRRRSGGRTVLFPSGDDELRKCISRLCAMGVERCGDVRITGGTESLLVEYTHDRTLRRALCHARLVWESLRGPNASYLQMPREALRVQSDDAAVAVSLARFWRQNIVTVALDSNAPGIFRTSLFDLLGQLDVDIQAGTRHYGRAWWRREAERLQRVARAATLGEVSWSTSTSDPGPATEVILTPSTGLESAYRPLAAMIIAKRTAKHTQLKAPSRTAK
jgi:hypothetical protein